MVSTRSRSVCIRVSEDELRILREACQQSGARTVSELAREAMHLIVSTGHPTPLGGQKLKFWLLEMSGRLASLQTEVDRLAKLPQIDGWFQKEDSPG